MSAPENRQSQPINADPDAMAEVATVPGAFHFNISSPPQSKRKRRSDHLDDGDDIFGARDSKRRSPAIHSLPIRLSPGRPNISVSPAAFSLYTSIYQQPPTPVDTSDDESFGQQIKDDDQWDLSKQDSQPRSDGSTSSARAPSGDLDVDMEMTSTLVAQPRIRRARSNDIIPPERDSNLLSALDIFSRERVPTPISSHFDSRVSEVPNASRHQFPPLRTALSPMIEQESWISRDGLPSPVEDEDMDMMDRDDSINKGDYFGKYGLDGNSSPSGRARTGRLHMGFLHDCEKCVQKVPGHYSHIIWS